ncbi:Chaperone protein DnaJ [Alphaproteobacteria bacterium]
MIHGDYLCNCHIEPIIVMSKSDYYQTLKVPREADAGSIKKAYRKLAMQYHPDRNPGNRESEQKFKEINEAYEVLKDGQKRAAYDRFGHSAFQAGGAGSSGKGFEGGFHTEDYADFSDIFSGIFDDIMGRAGSKRPGHQQARGADLKYNLTITLEEAFHGKKQNIKYKSTGRCIDCEGTGSKSKSGNVTCLACGGKGKIRSQQGFFTIERTCSACGETGTTIKDPCLICGGTGIIEKQKTLAISIPKGVEDGTRIKITGEGEAGIRGSSSGDLYVFVQVKKHNLYTREGRHLICEVPVKMTIGALGGSIEIPGIDGSLIKVSIPAGTQTNAQFRLQAKGMPVLNSSACGDLFIHIKVETPVNLTSHQKELLEQFEKDSHSNSSPNSTGFFEKVKNFWSDITRQSKEGK